MSEIKLTRNIRKQLDGLMSTYSNISLRDIEFLDDEGEKINPELQYVNALQNQMLEAEDLNPVDKD